MALRIDRIAGFVAALAVGFVCFLNGTGSIGVALALTGALALALRLAVLKWGKTLGARRTESRARRDASRALVAEWVIHPDEAEAARYVEALYGAQPSTALSLLARHPSARALDAQDVLEAWRTAREDQLVLLSTGKVAPSAVSVAQALNSPRVLLMDGEALAGVVAQSGLPIPECPRPARPPRVHRLSPSRARAPLCLTYSLFMMLAYYVTGMIIYLILFLILLAVSVLGFRRPKPPERLF